MTAVLCPELIGRASEFRALAAALRSALGGRGGAAFVIGEPGIGKSRLATDVADQARRDGVSVVTGRAVPAGAGTAYRPLAEALAQALRDREVPGDPSLAPWLPALGDILPALAAGALPAGAPPAGALPAGAPPAEASLAARGEAVVLLLRRLAQPAGLALILEDLHWADPDTLAIVEYLADNLTGSAVLAIATCRTEPDCPALEMIARLHSRRSSLHVRLGRLDDDQVAQMARACVPGADDRLIARVQRTCDGVPFLVEEVLAAPGVPTSFAGAVAARLESCTQAERLVLDAAAVLGRAFDWRLLPSITGLPDGQVARALERGVRSLLLTADAGSFRFRHALTREALAAAMLPPRRADLAARALAVIGRGDAGPEDGWLDTAADLAAQSGDTARAVTLLADSGQRSLGRGALATATATLERAADLLTAAGVPRMPPGAAGGALAGDRAGGHAGALAAGPGGQEGEGMRGSGRREILDGALRVDSLLVEAYALAGRVDDAVAVGDRLIAGLTATTARPGGGAGGGATGDVAGDAAGDGVAWPADIQLRLAHAAVAAARWPLASARLDAAAELLGAEQDPGLAARTAVLRAEVALAADDTGLASRLAGGVLAQDAASPEVRCHALELAGRIERITGLDAARDAFERALATADEAGLPVWRLRALHELGTIELFDRVGTDRLEQARHAAEQLGALSTTAVLNLQLAVAYTWRFDLDAGAERARSALYLAGRLGLGEVTRKATYILAENSGQRLDREQMERYLAQCAPATVGERYLAAFAWGCRGMADLLAGDWATARELLGKAVGQLSRLPQAEPAQFRAWWPLVLAMSGDDAAGGEIEAARRQGVAVARPNRGLLGYAGAILAGRSGDPRAAAELATAADADLGCVPVFRDLARACAAWSALAGGWGNPERWLTEARGRFSDRGLDGLARRCDELLGRRRPGRWEASGVTPREADVLGLVAQGLRNKDIASRLYLSPRTVEKHVESLLRKTGVRSRSQLAAEFAAEFAAELAGEPAGEPAAGGAQRGAGHGAVAGAE